MDTMQLQPKPADYPRIRKALSFYKVTSVITGVMLLMLCAVMVMKYAFNVQLFLFTEDGFAHFYELAPEGLESDFQASGFDLFKAILIAHGWFYVVYLVSDFLLWSPMRWGFLKFLLIALGGVIPFMSFFLEARIVREVNGFLDAREGAPASDTSTSPSAASSATTSKGSLKQ